MGIGYSPRPRVSPISPLPSSNVSIMAIAVIKESSAIYIESYL
ncbi:MULTISPECIES: hypothetical protein [Nostoc]|nr:MULTISPECIES: hypothetical protein [Nostoc]